MKSTLTDRLVRLSLGLPDPGMTHDGDFIAQAASRALLRVDGYAAGEQLRLAEIVASRSVVIENTEPVQERDPVRHSR